MYRLKGHVLPDNKTIWIALTHIYGIGQIRSAKILDDIKIDPRKKVLDLDDMEKKNISDALKDFTLENDLKREIQGNIKRLKEIKCYRGMRHNLWLPTRGQSTKKNARTAKKLLWRSRVRPVLKK